MLLYIMPVMDGDDQEDEHCKEEEFVEYVGGKREAARSLPEA